MVTNRELALIKELRKDSRQFLTEVGKALSIPPTSLYILIQRLERRGVIRKYVSLVDYDKLGYSVRVCLNVKVKDKEGFKEFMMDHANVNSLSKVMGASRFSAELVFASLLELEDFLEGLEEFGVQWKEVFHLVEEFKCEGAELKP